MGARALFLPRREKFSRSETKQGNRRIEVCSIIADFMPNLHPTPSRPLLRAALSRFLLILALCLLPSLAPGATFVVNQSGDQADANLGDGIADVDAVAAG